MSKLAPFVALATSIVIAACSAGDPGSSIPFSSRGHASGPSAGGGNSGGAGATGGGSDHDAGPPPAPTYFDSGAPPPFDASAPTRDASAPTRDASAPPAQGPPGTCDNPICGADGQGDCGCFAHDTNGNRVELGCSAETCACFTNGQETSDATSVPGVCSGATDMQLQFTIACGCN
jgi:hypothetical protein